MLGTFLFLTYYLQQTLHYSALKTGFAYLPFSVGIVAGRGHRQPAHAAGAAAHRHERRSARWRSPGCCGSPRSACTPATGCHVFPAEIVMAFGMGMVFVPVNNTALVGVAAVRRRRGQRPDQLHPAGGRLGRDRPAQHHRHHGHGHLRAGATPAGSAEPLAPRDRCTAISVAFAVAGAILGLALSW